MSSLWELTSDYKKVMDLIESDTTEIATIKDTLESIEGAIEEKAANIVKFVRSLEFDVDSIKTEEKRLSDRRKAIENKISNIKEYLQSNMELAGLGKIKTPITTISIQNNPPAVNIIDGEKIPSKFITIIPKQHVPDKKRIADALKSGEEVPGCELKQGKSLRIR